MDVDEHEKSAKKGSKSRKRNSEEDVEIADESKRPNPKSKTAAIEATSAKNTPSKTSTKKIITKEAHNDFLEELSDIEEDDIKPKSRSSFI